MANVYVLGFDGAGIKLALHIDVPATNNAAGVSWSNAIARSGLYKGTTVLTDGDDTGGTIGATEKSALAAFTRVEVLKTFQPDAAFAGQSGAQRGAAIDAFYNQAKTDVQNEIQAKLNFFGLTR